MPRSSPSKDAKRQSDSANSPSTPVRAGGSRASGSAGTRSLSPRKRHSKQPLHIRMNLTETQMDRITDAFSRGVDISPVKSRNGSPSKLVEPDRQHQASFAQHSRGHSHASDDMASGTGNSTTFSELMPRQFETSGSNHSLAERRHRATPAPILVDSQHRPRSTVRRAEVQSNAREPPHSDLHLMHTIDPTYQDAEVAHEPLTVLSPQPDRSKRTQLVEDGTPYFANTPYLAAYDQWANVNVPQNTKAHGYENTRGPHQEQASPTKAKPPQLLSARDVASPMFSPFPFYFHGQGLPAEKRGGKTMIGENGWLERPGEAPDPSLKRGGRKPGLIDGIKKIAKDMSEQYSSTRRGQQPAPDTSRTPLVISLNAREQSLLYGELEYHLSNALNTYITVQLEKGRLLTDRLHKISDHWLQLGRPRVVGFRYDLEMQLDIVKLHVQEFVFFGRRQGNPVEIGGLLDAMQVNARAMRVRTFCQPDAAIAKHLVDSQSLFNLVGAGREEDLALAEIAQFFKVCIEREKLVRDKELRKARQSIFHHAQRQEAKRGTG